MPSSPRIAIRPAVPEDAVAIARVHVDSWRTTYRDIVPLQAYLAKLSYQEREKLWTRVVNDSSQFTFVAVEEGQVIGFSNGGKNRGKDPEYSGELYSIYLLESYQRRGWGRRLMRVIAEKLALAGMPSMIVWVLTDNPARGFYEALGGRWAGSKPIVIGGVTLEEVAFGWADIRPILDTGR